MTWEEHENPWALLATGLRDRGAATGRIGIEETTYWVYSDGLAKQLPGATLTSGTPVTAGCRMVKSPAELALMRLASEVTLKAYKAAWQCLREGMTQAEFAELVRLAHERLGFSGEAGVQVGPASALPHGSSKPQVVREGTILLIDGGCTRGRLRLRPEPHLRPRQRHRPDEAGLRHRAPGPDHGASRPRVPGCPARPSTRRPARSSSMPASAPATSTSPTGWDTAWAWTGTSGPTS